MTCIAVKIDGKKIEIAGDTQTTWGGNKQPKEGLADKSLKAHGKIFQTNGMTIGCAGSVAHIGLLQIFAKTHKPKEMERDSILDWVIEFKAWAKEKADINQYDLSFHGIIVSEERAFCFYDFMDIKEVNHFDAVGSGMWLALGAMEQGASAEQAVNTAIKYDLYCGGEPTKIILE